MAQGQQQSNPAVAGNRNSHNKPYLSQPDPRFRTPAIPRDGESNSDPLSGALPLSSRSQTPRPVIQQHPPVNPATTVPSSTRKRPHIVILVLKEQVLTLARIARPTSICGLCDVAALPPSEPSGKPERKTTHVAALSELIAEPLLKPSLTPAMNSKKGPVKHRSDVVCSAYACSLGVGQMQVCTDDPLHSQRRREEWAEPDYAVEVVCLPCWMKYQYFIQLQTLFETHCPLFYLVLAVAETGHTVHASGARVSSFAQAVAPVASATSGLAPSRTVPNHAILRGRGTSKEMEASVEFRTSLPVAKWETGKLKAKRGNFADAPRADPEPPTLSSPPSVPPPRLHGFMGLHVNHYKGVIYLAHACVLHPSQPVMSGLFLAAITGATAEHRAHYWTSPPLAYFCAPLFRVDPDEPALNSHPSNWGVYGFGPVDKNVVGKPIQASLFDEPGIIPDAVRERQENWVASVHELLEWCDSIDNVP
ncbi:hypothetical protein BDK51DRAFT_41173 [Blyttiomyces helicus]|uniref:Uncharacterized protein n=1 Tax=Blyttiomyces helicus TaxID=388810 RepID=A0A4P9VWT8_9FUNG|nr:hypothetical protein BDK51DRAFT_41173 [Blyttiomyces helicus]|eukprot:RKO83153.1 hypothetical protein BDK51DRAFT_41173 [Blyttiomyces helicus]